VDLTRYIEEHNFIFDNVFDENTTNKVLYTEVVQPLVLQAFKGVKITCFAYGQTGSGKTFTMMGAPNKELQIDDSSGVFLLAANDIFSIINKVIRLSRKKSMLRYGYRSMRFIVGSCLICSLIEISCLPEKMGSKYIN
jgi:chromosomal replication initiation ATPase DnaA